MALASSEQQLMASYRGGTPKKNLATSSPPSQASEMERLVWIARHFIPFCKPIWPRLLLVFLLIVPVGSLDGAMMLGVKAFVDSILGNQSVGAGSGHVASMLSIAVPSALTGVLGPNIQVPLWGIPFFILGFTALQGSLIYLLNYTDWWIAGRLNLAIKRVLLNRLLTYQTAWFDSANTGEIIAHFVGDVDTAINGVIQNLRAMLVKTVSSIGLIAVLLWQSWFLAIIAVSVLVITVLPVSHIRRKLKRLSEEYLSEGGKFFFLYTELFAGIRVIRGFQLESAFQQRFDRTTEGLFGLGMRAVKTGGWVTPMMHITSGIAVGVILWLGVAQIRQGALTPGGFAAFMASLILLYTPLKSLSGTWLQLQNGVFALERVFTRLEGSDCTEISVAPDQAETLHHRFEREITFQDVTFGYDVGQPVLKRVNFVLPKGKCLALVGPSGSGKSTIAALLPRFYTAQEGDILIDGIAINRLTLSELRHMMTIVFQDNFMFEGSIRDNLLLVKPQATDDELWDVLEKTHLKQFVSGLPDTLDTWIGERGVSLSGGQRQRLAIARAFLKDSPILILDEATSALDSQAEEQVQAALKVLMKDRTVLVIAHRLSTIKDADWILVLNQGSLEEQGTHQSLLAANGLYSLLWHKQTSGAALSA